MLSYSANLEYMYCVHTEYQIQNWCGQGHVDNCNLYVDAYNDRACDIVLNVHY